MSGIAGIVHLDGAPVDRALLEQMAGFLRFRGPDGQRVWTSGHVGFVHAALHVTPESPLWPQPLQLEQRWWITGDVRLDGLSDLKRTLQSHGAELPPQADDSLLVLHAYRLWGRDCLQHLRGDFSFAVWDAPVRRLFCARDHIGIRPFFYARTRHAFVFGNTLDCLRLHPEVSDELDESAISDFLLFGCSQRAEDTAFAAIRRLPAAHWIEVGPAGIEMGRYWEPPRQQKRSGGSARQYREEFSALLQQAIQERLRAPRAAIFLSGGLDSTTIAALARKTAPGCGLEARTLGYDRLFSDPEPAWARRAAEALSIPWRYRALDDVRLFENYAAAAPPEPSLESLAAVMQQELAEVARASAVAFSGEGGDLLLMPPVVGAGFTPRDLPATLRQMWRQRRIPRIGLRTALRKRLAAPPPRPFPAWIAPDLQQRMGLRERWKEARRAPAPAGASRPQMYASVTSLYWRDAVESVDAGFTRQPVDMQFPFLSVSLLEYVLTGPTHMENFLEKGLLREITREMLPRELRRRPKCALSGNPVLARLREGRWYQPPGMGVSPELANYVAPGTPARFSDAGAQRAAEFVGVIALNYWLEFGWKSCAQRELRAAAAPVAGPCS